jgi:3-oxoacyl-[acyl-carrier protein] reductase
MEKLKNKKVVITGGSSGIGKVIAAEYLTQGAEIYLLGNGKEMAATQTELSAKGTVHTFLTDVSKPEEVERAAAEVAKTFGTVDVLINGAGIYGPIGPVTEVDPELWRKAIEVNLFGTFLSVHFIAPLLKNDGTIINFVGGGEGPFPNFSSYVSSKGAIARFSETLAAELHEKGITVNAIAPGAVNTKFLEDLLAAGPEKAGKKNYEQALKQKAEGGTPPEKAAALCVFLASEEARGITGKIFSAVWDPYLDFPKHKEELETSNVYTMRRVRAEWLGFGWGDALK